MLYAGKRVQALSSLVEREPSRSSARVTSMTRGDAHWLVQDEAGALYKVDLVAQTVDLLFTFHSRASICARKGRGEGR